MEHVCHRCGTALNGSEPFCPHCAAPQLRYEASEDESPSANTLPTQRFSVRNPDVISWRDAIPAAILVALPAGLLSSLLGVEALWGVAGGVAIISMYHRRTGTHLTSRMGWHIGAVLGLFAAVIAAAINGIALLVQRYALHQGSILDQHFHDIAETFTKMYVNQFASSNPDMAASLAGVLHFWVTPDGAAAMVLSNAVGLAVSLLLFAAIGGALGARLTQKAPHPTAR